MKQSTNEWNEQRFNEWYDSYSAGHPPKSSVMGYLVRKLKAKDAECEAKLKEQKIELGRAIAEELPEWGFTDPDVRNFLSQWFPEVDLSQLNKE